jgi:REP element-mobilizing transposase RayT
MNLVSGGHSSGQNLYHFEWRPRYRYNIFKHEGNKKLCEEALRGAAGRYGMKILELSVMPDYIHLIAPLPSTLSVPKAFNLLKGASSHELFERQLKFRLRYPKGEPWSLGKFYRSIGDADLQTLRNYA